jgi:hypothetical protein
MYRLISGMRIRQHNAAIGDQLVAHGGEFIVQRPQELQESLGKIAPSIEIRRRRIYLKSSDLRTNTRSRGHPSLLG